MLSADPPAQSPKKAEETRMAWYISYRAGGSTVMHIFKKGSSLSLPRVSFSVAVLVIRSKSGRCAKHGKERCSTSETSSGSDQQRPLRPLGRYRLNVIRLRTRSTTG